MTQQTINLGTGPNTGDGDPLRNGGSKINANFTELYTAINNANLQALSGLIGAADRIPYFTGVGALSLATLTAYSRGLLALTTAAAWKGATGLNLVKADVGLPNADDTSDVNKPVSTAQAVAIATKQAAHVNLTSLASIAAAADRVPIFTGASTASYLPAGTSGKSLLAAATTDAAQTALGATAVGKALLIAANAAAGRTALTLGTAATENVTTSATDTTTGRILKIGDFGLGIALVSATTDLNTYTSPGSYIIPASGVTGLPHDWAQGRAVLTVDGGLSYAQQVISRDGYFASRWWNGSVWGVWSWEYNEKTIVGTVSQSGGVPTGAIIESGSNSNGEYVKYADGTMICSAVVRMNSVLTTDILGATWTFPIPFVDASKVRILHSPMQGASADCAPTLKDRFGPVINSITTSSVSVRSVSATGAAAFAAGNFIDTHVIAKGNWF